MDRIFLLCILLFVFSCNTEMTLKKEVFETFVKAIDAHDSASIKALVSNEEVLTGASAAWDNYFSWFADYKLEIESYGETNGQVAAFGFASGSLKGDGKTEEAFRIPVAIKAEIQDGKVADWQIYGETTKMDALMVSANGRDRNDLAVKAFGGVFFKAKDPKAMCAWYDQHLGTRFGKATYSYFKWSERDQPGLIGSTSYGIFNEKSEYYAPSTSPFMLNFRVNNLDALMEKLKADGVQMVGEIDRVEYGNFGWIMDPEGNKIELWEPVDAVLDAYEKEQGN